MKKLNRVFVALALACVFAVSVSAGDMSAGGAPPPQSTTTDATGSAVVNAVVTLLVSVVSVP